MIVGGGVIGDLAGFAAASFLRGLRVVQVPTTVVAQVDSAIGGKVGVNHARGKNLIGAFHPPLGVLVDPDLLATLPARELRAGLYEVVKYGVIADRRLFTRLERDLDRIRAGDPEALLPIVVASARIKAHVVSVDEHETGLRRILNSRPHARPRPRGDHALPPLQARRGGGLGDAGGGGRGPRPPRDERGRGRPRRGADRSASGRGRRSPICRRAACVAATARDKKVLAGTLHFVLPTGIGRDPRRHRRDRRRADARAQVARDERVNAERADLLHQQARRHRTRSRRRAARRRRSPCSAAAILRFSTSSTTRRVASSSVPLKSI